MWCCTAWPPRWRPPATSAAFSRPPRPRSGSWTATLRSWRPTASTWSPGATRSACGRCSTRSRRASSRAREPERRGRGSSRSRARPRRSSFLDAALARRVAALPAAERTAGEKQLLRDAVAGFGELASCRILDRPKERFSDGTGFSYVPDLLRRVAASPRWGGERGDDGTMPCRLAAEARAYAAMFEDAYGAPAGRWVVGRTMPVWTEAVAAEGARGNGLVNYTRPFRKRRQCIDGNTIFLAHLQQSQLGMGHPSASFFYAVRCAVHVFVPQKR